MTKKWNKLCALFLLVTFSGMDILSPYTAYGAISIPSAREVSLPNLGFSLDMPTEIGTIEALHSGTGPTLVHIQTAHGNYEAQKNIQKILTHLYQEYGFRHLLLEGSSFELDSELLNLLPNRPEDTREVLDRLTKKALVKGPELFLAEHPDARGYGIEKLESYLANGEAFRKVLTAQEKTTAFLEDMDQQINRLSGTYLNHNLRQFVKMYENYELGRYPFQDWLHALKNHAKEYLEIDLDSPAYQIDWPMLLRVFTLEKIEAEINLAKYRQERVAFLKEVDGKISEQLFERVERLTKNPQNPHQLSDPETYLLVEKMMEALPATFRIERFPEVTKILGRMIIHSELQGEALMDEMKSLTDQVSSKMAKTKEEKEVLAVLKDYWLLEKLFVLELTPNDHAELLSRGELAKPAQIAKRFSSINGGSRVRDIEFKNLEAIEELYRESIRFYRYVGQRDQDMIRNVTRKISELDTSKAVIVTGGFHANPFQQYFQSQNYSYALIMPKIHSMDGKDNYIESILNLQVPASTYESVPFGAHSDQVLTNGFKMAPSRVETLRMRFLAAVHSVLAPKMTGQAINDELDSSKALSQYEIRRVRGPQGQPGYGFLKGAKRIGWAPQTQAEIVTTTTYSTVDDSDIINLAERRQTRDANVPASIAASETRAPDEPEWESEQAKSERVNLAFTQRMVEIVQQAESKYGLDALDNHRSRSAQEAYEQIAAAYDEFLKEDVPHPQDPDNLLVIARSLLFSRFDQNLILQLMPFFAANSQNAVYHGVLTQPFSLMMYFGASYLDPEFVEGARAANQSIFEYALERLTDAAGKSLRPYVTDEVRQGAREVVDYALIRMPQDAGSFEAAEDYSRAADTYDRVIKIAEALERENELYPEVVATLLGNDILSKTLGGRWRRFSDEANRLRGLALSETRMNVESFANHIERAGGEAFAEPIRNAGLTMESFLPGTQTLGENGWTRMSWRRVLQTLSHLRVQGIDNDQFIARLTEVVREIGVVVEQQGAENLFERSVSGQLHIETINDPFNLTGIAVELLLNDDGSWNETNTQRGNLLLDGIQTYFLATSEVMRDVERILSGEDQQDPEVIAEGFIENGMDDDAVDSLLQARFPDLEARDRNHIIQTSKVSVEMSQFADRALDDIGAENQTDFPGITSLKERILASVGQDGDDHLVAVIGGRGFLEAMALNEQGDLSSDYVGATEDALAEINQKIARTGYSEALNRGGTGRLSKSETRHDDSKKWDHPNLDQPEATFVRYLRLLADEDRTDNEDQEVTQLVNRMQISGPKTLLALAEVLEADSSTLADILVELARKRKAEQWNNFLGLFEQITHQQRAYSLFNYAIGALPQHLNEVQAITSDENYAFESAARDIERRIERMKVEAEKIAEDEDAPDLVLAEDIDGLPTATGLPADTVQIAEPTLENAEEAILDYLQLMSDESRVDDRDGEISLATTVLWDSGEQTLMEIAKALANREGQLSEFIISQVVDEKEGVRHLAELIHMLALHTQKITRGEIAFNNLLEILQIQELEADSEAEKFKEAAQFVKDMQAEFERKVESTDIILSTDDDPLAQSETRATIKIDEGETQSLGTQDVFVGKIITDDRVEVSVGDQSSMTDYHLGDRVGNEGYYIYRIDTTTKQVEFAKASSETRVSSYGYGTSGGMVPSFSMWQYWNRDFLTPNMQLINSQTGERVINRVQVVDKDLNVVDDIDIEVTDATKLSEVSGITTTLLGKNDKFTYRLLASGTLLLTAGRDEDLRYGRKVSREVKGVKETAAFIESWDELVRWLNAMQKHVGQPLHELHFNSEKWRQSMGFDPRADRAIDLTHPNIQIAYAKNLGQALRDKYEGRVQISPDTPLQLEWERVAKKYNRLKVTYLANGFTAQSETRVSQYGYGTSGGMVPSFTMWTYWNRDFLTPNMQLINSQTGERVINRVQVVDKDLNVVDDIDIEVTDATKLSEVSGITTTLLGKNDKFTYRLLASGTLLLTAGRDEDLRYGRKVSREVKGVKETAAFIESWDELVRWLNAMQKHVGQPLHELHFNSEKWRQSMGFDPRADRAIDLTHPNIQIAYAKNLGQALRDKYEGRVQISPDTPLQLEWERVAKKYNRLKVTYLANGFTAQSETRSNIKRNIAILVALGVVIAGIAIGPALFNREGQQVVPNHLQAPQGERAPPADAPFEESDAVKLEALVRLNIDSALEARIEGNEAEAVRLLNTALKLADQLLAINPDSNLYLLRGDINYLLGPENEPKVIADNKKAIELDPTNELAYDNLLRAYLRSKQDSEAHSYFHTLTEKYAGNPLALKYQGKLHEYMGYDKLDAAKKAFEEENQAQADQHYNAAMNLWAEANAYYLMAIDLDPENLDILNSLGVTYSLLGVLPEAEEAYERSIAIDEFNVEALEGLVRIYEETNQPEKAAEATNKLRIALENQIETETTRELDRPESPAKSETRAGTLQDNLRLGINYFEQEIERVLATVGTETPSMVTLRMDVEDARRYLEAGDMNRTMQRLSMAMFHLSSIDIRQAAASPTEGFSIENFERNVLSWADQVVQNYPSTTFFAYSTAISIVTFDIFAQLRNISDIIEAHRKQRANRGIDKLPDEVRSDLDGIQMPASLAHQAFLDDTVLTSAQDQGIDRASLERGLRDWLTKLNQIRGYRQQAEEDIQEHWQGKVDPEVLDEINDILSRVFNEDDGYVSIARTLVERAQKHFAQLPPEDTSAVAQSETRIDFDDEFRLTPPDDSNRDGDSSDSNENIALEDSDVYPSLAEKAQMESGVFKASSPEDDREARRKKMQERLSELSEDSKWLPKHFALDGDAQQAFEELMGEDYQLVITPNEGEDELEVAIRVPDSDQEYKYKVNQGTNSYKATIGLLGNIYGYLFNLRISGPNFRLSKAYWKDVGMVMLANMMVPIIPIAIVETIQRVFGVNLVRGPEESIMALIGVLLYLASAAAPGILVSEFINNAYSSVGQVRNRVSAMIKNYIESTHSDSIDGEGEQPTAQSETRATTADDDRFTITESTWRVSGDIDLYEGDVVVSPYNESERLLIKQSQGRSIWVTAIDQDGKRLDPRDRFGTNMPRVTVDGWFLFPGPNSDLPATAQSETRALAPDLLWAKWKFMEDRLSKGAPDTLKPGSSITYDKVESGRVDFLKITNRAVGEPFGERIGYIVTRTKVYVADSEGVREIELDTSGDADSGELFFKDRKRASDYQVLFNIRPSGDYRIINGALLTGAASPEFVEQATLDVRVRTASLSETRELSEWQEDVRDSATRHIQDAIAGVNGISQLTLPLSTQVQGRPAAYQAIADQITRLSGEDVGLIHLRDPEVILATLFVTLYPARRPDVVFDYFDRLMEDDDAEFRAQILSNKKILTLYHVARNIDRASVDGALDEVGLDGFLDENGKNGFFGYIRYNDRKLGLQSETNGMLEGVSFAFVGIQGGIVETQLSAINRQDVNRAIEIVELQEKIDPSSETATTLRSTWTTLVNLQDRLDNQDGAQSETRVQVSDMRDITEIKQTILYPALSVWINDTPIVGKNFYMEGIAFPDAIEHELNEERSLANLSPAEMASLEVEYVSNLIKKALVDNPAEIVAQDGSIIARITSELKSAAANLKGNSRIFNWGYYRELQVIADNPRELILTLARVYDRLGRIPFKSYTEESVSSSNVDDPAAQSNKTGEVESQFRAQVLQGVTDQARKYVSYQPTLRDETLNIYWHPDKDAIVVEVIATEVSENARRQAGTLWGFLEMQGYFFGLELMQPKPDDPVAKYTLVLSNPPAMSETRVGDRLTFGDRYDRADQTLARIREAVEPIHDILASDEEIEVERRPDRLAELGYADDDQLLNRLTEIAVDVAKLRRDLDVLNRSQAQEHLVIGERTAVESLGLKAAGLILGDLMREARVIGHQWRLILNTAVDELGLEIKTPDQAASETRAASDEGGIDDQDWLERARREADFLLQPVYDEDEWTDGSQVIALEDSDVYEEGSFESQVGQRTDYQLLVDAFNERWGDTLREMGLTDASINMLRDLFIKWVTNEGDQGSFINSLRRIDIAFHPEKRPGYSGPKVAEDIRESYNVNRLVERFILDIHEYDQDMSGFIAAFATFAENLENAEYREAFMWLDSDGWRQDVVSAFPLDTPNRFVSIQRPDDARLTGDELRSFRSLHFINHVEGGAFLRELPLGLEFEISSFNRGQLPGLELLGFRRDQDNPQSYFRAVPIARVGQREEFMSRWSDLHVLQGVGVGASAIARESDLVRIASWIRAEIDTVRAGNPDGLTALAINPRGITNEVAQSETRKIDASLGTMIGENAAAIDSSFYMLDQVMDDIQSAGGLKGIGAIANITNGNYNQKGQAPEEIEEAAVEIYKSRGIAGLFQSSLQVKINKKHGHHDGEAYTNFARWMIAILPETESQHLRSRLETWQAAEGGVDSLADQFNLLVGIKFPDYLLEMPDELITVLEHEMYHLVYFDRFEPNSPPTEAFRVVLESEEGKELLDSIFGSTSYAPKLNGDVLNIRVYKDAPPLPSGRIPAGFEFEDEFWAQVFQPGISAENHARLTDYLSKLADENDIVREGYGVAEEMLLIDTGELVNQVREDIVELFPNTAAGQQFAASETRKIDAALGTQLGDDVAAIDSSYYMIDMFIEQMISMNSQSLNEFVVRVVMGKIQNAGEAPSDIEDGARFFYNSREMHGAHQSIHKVELKIRDGYIGGLAFHRFATWFSNILAPKEGDALKQKIQAWQSAEGGIADIADQYHQFVGIKFPDYLLDNPELLIRVLEHEGFHKTYRSVWTPNSAPTEGYRAILENQKAREQLLLIFADTSYLINLRKDIQSVDELKDAPPETTGRVPVGFYFEDELWAQSLRPGLTPENQELLQQVLATAAQDSQEVRDGLKVRDQWFDQTLADVERTKKIIAEQFPETAAGQQFAASETRLSVEDAKDQLEGILKDAELTPQLKWYESLKDSFTKPGDLISFVENMIDYLRDTELSANPNNFQLNRAIVDLENLVGSIDLGNTVAFETPFQGGRAASETRVIKLAAHQEVIAQTVMRGLIAMHIMNQLALLAKWNLVKGLVGEAFASQVKVDDSVDVKIEVFPQGTLENGYLNLNKSVAADDLDRKRTVVDHRQNVPSSPEALDKLIRAALSDEKGLHYELWFDGELGEFETQFKAYAISEYGKAPANLIVKQVSGDVSQLYRNEIDRDQAMGFITHDERVARAVGYHANVLRVKATGLSEDKRNQVGVVTQATLLDEETYQQLNTDVFDGNDLLDRWQQLLEQLVKSVAFQKSA